LLVLGGLTDGGNSDPRGLSVTADTTITALYSITPEPITELAVAFVGLPVTAGAVAVLYLGNRRSGLKSLRFDPMFHMRILLFPWNDSLPGEPS
jgi:hypothetical protein